MFAMFVNILRNENPHLLACFTIFCQLIEQTGPLLTEEVCAGQTAVSTNHHQVRDAALHQVVSRLQTPRPLAEVLASSAANHCAALVNEHKAVLGCILNYNALRHIYGILPMSLSVSSIDLPYLWYIKCVLHYCMKFSIVSTKDSARVIILPIYSNAET